MRDLFSRSRVPSKGDAGVGVVLGGGLGVVVEGAELPPLPLASETASDTVPSRPTSPPVPGRSSSCSSPPTMASPVISAPVLSPTQWFAREERKAIDAYLQVSEEQRRAGEGGSVLT